MKETHCKIKISTKGKILANSLKYWYICAVIDAE
jgi:hypothetical protein